MNKVIVLLLLITSQLCDAQTTEPQFVMQYTINKKMSLS